MSERPFPGAIGDAFPFLVAGLVASPLLLAVPSSWDLTLRVIAHLSALVALGVVVAVVIARRLEEPFFSGLGWSRRTELLAAAAVLVVVPTGVVGLVTLASAAAMRFDVSMQFLQLLSALDIAWAAAAIVVGARARWGAAAAIWGGVALGIACVASIWNYLRVVGYTDAGGWVVDGGRLMTLVIPFDTLAALIAVGVLYAGVQAVSAHRAGE